VAGGGSPAELSLALMMACAWNLPAADGLIRRGGWAFQPGVPLRGKVLGIAGYGNLGKPMARYGQAIGMRILAWSRSLTDEAARTDGVERADKDRLIAQSDVISVHLPLNDSTVGIIGAGDIARMKRGVILVNTARATVVDQPAMIAALRSGQISMAGLDVFEQEPLPRNHPLRRLPNVVMTPHIGYVSADSLAGMYAAIIRTLVAYRQGTPIGVYKPRASGSGGSDDTP
jgi:phosphoglycerate dehydrogenase-like enzyme